MNRGGDGKGGKPPGKSKPSSPPIQSIFSHVDGTLEPAHSNSREDVNNEEATESARRSSGPNTATRRGTNPTASRKSTSYDPTTAAAPTSSNPDLAAKRRSSNPDLIASASRASNHDPNAEAKEVSAVYFPNSPGEEVELGLEEIEKTPSADSAVSKGGFYGFFLKYRGILLAIITSIAASLMSFVSKYLMNNESFSPGACLFWRTPLILILSTAEIIYQTFGRKEKVFETVWPLSENDKRKTFIILILSRVLLGPASMISQYWAFQYLQLGDAQTIIFSNAVFVTLFAHWILKESWGVVPIVASCITVIGVVIISKPAFITGSNTGYSENHLMGLGFAFLSMILYSFVLITMRMLSHVHSSVPVLTMSLGTLFWGLVVSLSLGTFKVPKTATAVGLFVALNVITCVASVCFTLALQYEEAGLVALIRCSEVVYSFLLQMIMAVYPDEYSLIGATIVLFCIFIVFFRKYLKRLPKTHYLVKKLWFLLK